MKCAHVIIFSDLEHDGVTELLNGLPDFIEKESYSTRAITLTLSAALFLPLGTCTSPAPSA